jgi:hypothetical protein
MSVVLVQTLVVSSKTMAICSWSKGRESDVISEEYENEVNKELTKEILMVIVINNLSLEDNVFSTTT